MLTFLLLGLVFFSFILSLIGIFLPFLPGVWFHFIVVVIFYFFAPDEHRISVNVLYLDGVLVIVSIILNSFYEKLGKWIYNSQIASRIGELAKRIVFGTNLFLTLGWSIVLSLAEKYLAKKSAYKTVKATPMIIAGFAVKLILNVILLFIMFISFVIGFSMTYF